MGQQPLEAQAERASEAGLDRRKGERDDVDFVLTLIQRISSDRYIIGRIGHNQERVGLSHAFYYYRARG